ncbi:NERD domain-containing protein [Jeotgalibaca sp. MA1X17-3]|uniref:nuclease-related domain-containing protein n=1 Tax=Jeotgalibaca sp. MA1X17-3 TaxID=2908211 RepID=UPI001F382E64|nr:nuclease-related domain-containing protein [Jeotgalibaca sp. MA1X17-3]UJF16478.1 NERD domain-containing protein [Jeotgalibaca sp. MA1X17-3]
MSNFFISLSIPILYCLIAIILVFLFRMILIYYFYQKSSYKEATGENFFKLITNKGLYGEFLIFRKLEKYPEPKRILANIYLEKGKGTTEIDLIMISTNGIYVIESKNYGGKIYGSDKNKRWTQYLNGKKFNFFNPVWQNSAHISALEDYIGMKDSAIVHSYLVFSDRSDLKRIEITTSKVTVLQTRNLLRVLAKEKSMDVLTIDEMEQYYEKLKKCTLVDDRKKQEHIEYVRQRVK